VFITTFGGGAWDPVDVYLRDFVEDEGNPHVSSDIPQSPEFILRQATVLGPTASLRAGQRNRE
jgi:hypothetical protein